MLEGSLDSKILFVSDFLRGSEVSSGVILDEKRKALIVNAMTRAGLAESEYAFTVMYPFYPEAGNLSKAPVEQKSLARVACKQLINQSKANVIVPLGDAPLEFITGLENIHNQHCSILKVKAEFGNRKAVPLLHPEYIQRSYSDSVYLGFGCKRIAQESTSHILTIPERSFRLSLDLTFEETIAELEALLNASELAIDKETGSGIVNTCGFATSPTSALAVEVGPQKYTPTEFHKLWSVLKRIYESDIPKITQNGLYESQWASLYGINIRNITFDTMWAMKLLQPNLEKGLDNVGRIYTRFPYWKSDHSDWNNIRNWRDHLIYNCKDTTGTFEAKINQQQDINSRGLGTQFQRYMDMFPKLQKLTNTGIKVDQVKLEKIRADIARDLESHVASLDRQTEERIGRKINHNSHTQVKKALKEMGLKVTTAKGKETVAKEALIKMRKQYPEEMVLTDLIEISKLSYQLENYFNFNYDKDSRIRMSVDPLHDEFGSWKMSKNPFESGFDTGDAPKKVRGFLVADEGKWLLEARLMNFEERYLALDSGCQRMLKMINEGKSISRELAAAIFRKVLPHEQSKETKYAKELLVGASCAVGPRSMGYKLSAKVGLSFAEYETKRHIAKVYELFPALLQRQYRIKDKITRSRSLTNLAGKGITFYDRLNDDLFKKAYEWGLRSTKACLLTELAQAFDGILTVTDKSVLFQVDSPQKAFDIVHSCYDDPEGLFTKRFPVTFWLGKNWGGLERV